MMAVMADATVPEPDVAFEADSFWRGSWLRKKHETLPPPNLPLSCTLEEPMCALLVVSHDHARLAISKK